MRANPALAVALILAITLHAFEQIAIVAILEEVVGTLTVGAPAFVSELLGPSGGRSLVGLVFSSYLLASIVTTVWAGRTIDRSGATRPFAIALFLFGLGLLVATVATDMLVLILARTIQGAGGGALLTVAYAAVNRGFGPEDRPRVLAALSQAWVLPGILGPALAGWIADWIHWRASFALFIPFVPLVAWLALPSFRTTPALQPTLNPPSSVVPPGSRPGLASSLCLALGTLLVFWAPLQDQLPIALLGVGIGLVLAWGGIRRILPVGTLTLRPVLPALVGLKFLAFLAFFGTDSFIPMALQQIRHLGIFEASLSLTPAAVMWALASYVAARRPTASYPRVVTIGLLILALAHAVLLPVLFSVRVPTATVFVAWGIAGFGIGLAYLSMNELAMQATRTDQEGATGMALTIADSLGFAAGTGITGIVLYYSPRSGGLLTGQALGDGYALAWSINLLVALLTGLMAASRLRPPDRRASGRG